MAAFDRYLLRDLLGIFIAIFIVLELVVTIAVASRLLEKITLGSYPPNAVGFLITYAGLDSLPIVLPFAAFLAVLLTFGRYYRDNEAAAAFSVGIGYLSLCKVILQFVIPLAIFLLVFMLETLPIVKEHYQINRMAASMKMNVGAITEGRFIHLDDEMVVFVEETESAGNEIRNVFIARIKPDDAIVETAQAGRQADESDGETYLHLSEGRRYQGALGKTNLRVVDFAKHSIKLPSVDSLQIASRPKFRNTRELLLSGSPADSAELQRRISMSVSLIILSLVAFTLIRPSAHHGIRRDRYAKIGISIFVFLVYLNGIVTLTKLISQSAFFIYVLWSVQLLAGVWVWLSLAGILDRFKSALKERLI